MGCKKTKGRALSDDEGAGPSPAGRTANEDNFLEIVTFLRRHGVTFWLDQGTLLGVIRDGELLPWDKDIDISVWTEGFDKVLELSEELRRRGYYIEVHEDRDTIFLSKRKGYFIEICRHHIEGDRIVRRGAAPRATTSERALKRWLQRIPHPLFVRIRHFARKYMGKPPLWFHTPARLLSEFTTVRFLGQDAPVPAETEAYLAFKYGDDWRTPRRDWDVAAEDGAVVG